MPRHVLIAGLGLIGGSAGMALRARGWRVSYIDPHVSLMAALQHGAADEVSDDRARASVTLIATPLDVAIAQLPAFEGLVTSTCSVMLPLRAVETRARFVAGHPMAGSEQRGLSAARADLFVGKRWFLDERDPIVEELVRDCGAVADFVSAAEHDEAVALTSHLPQILSTALAAAIEPEQLRFAGSGLRTFLRLASSDASVWGPVIRANGDRIAPHAETVARLVREILESPEDAFARAQRIARLLDE